MPPCVPLRPPKDLLSPPKDLPFPPKDLPSRPKDLPFPPKDLPSPLSVHRISGELVKDEEALDRFWPEDVIAIVVLGLHVPIPVELDDLGRQPRRGALVHLVARVG